MIAAGFIQASCARQSQNPFFTDWNTPFQTPPFDQIREEHYMPAFKEGMAQHQKEIKKIANNPVSATFQNTIEVMEESGELLTKVNSVFENLTSSNTNDQLQSIAKEAAPLLSKHWDDIKLNKKLFQRVKAIYGQKDKLNLTTGQNMLLDKYYKDFVRGGANLTAEQKTELRKINKKLSVLSLKFGENILKEDNAFELVIDKEEDMAGLPDAVISAAAEAAKERGHAGKWVFTLHKPSLIPFLQYSPKRDLREKMFKGYINRGNNNNEYDNKNILTQMVSLRVKRAHLLGYKTHAGYMLEENMAQKPQNVYDLLEKIRQPALKMAQKEAQKLQKMIDEEGGKFKLQPWDWWYYAEKLKKEKYALDDELLRPYFRLENVRQGAFAVANKLYGITFTERNDIPKYQPDVKVYEVKEADGRLTGIFYSDYFPRAGKRGGAWMNSFRKQSRAGGKEVRPIICNVANLSKPTGDKPALLTFEEVSTLFHEFGHALHGLLSNRTYPTLTGTSVPRDFVEMPSQFMENFAAAPEVMKLYAKHYRTGEPIPGELIKKIKNAGHFNQGFATVEYLAASFLDMDWHTLTEPQEPDVSEFEKKSMQKTGLIPQIVERYRSTYFQHIFSGGYSAGYYSYVWAEVLDADAFEAFKENGLFDQKTATAFRKNILEAGGSDDPMKMYIRFRGAEPKIEPMLKRKGLM